MAIQYPQGYDDDFINTIKKLIDHVNEYGKTIQDLVADGQLTPTQYAQLIYTVEGLVKSGEIDKNDLSPGLKTEIEKVDDKVSKGALTRNDLDTTSNSNLWDINDFNEQSRAILQGLNPGDINAVLGYGNVKTSNIENYAVTSFKRTPKGYLGALLIGSSAKVPDLNTNNSTLTIYGTSYVYFDAKRYAVNQDITLDFYKWDGAPLSTQVLLYDIENNTFRLAASTLGDQSEWEIELMSFSFDPITKKLKSTFATFDFTVNGESRDNEKVESTIYYPAQEIYDHYIPSNDNTFSDFDYDTTTVEEYNNKLFSLLDAHDDYVSYRVEGQSQSGNHPIHRIRLRPQEYNYNIAGKRIPKILIACGLHGDEKSSIFSLYYFLKDLCENWHESSVLEYLRFNVEMIIIPLVNPDGFENNTRGNSRAVDINRNFSYNWTAEPEYSWGLGGGTEPFSESETVVVRDLILDNKDAIYFCDYHTNNGSGDDQNKLLWFSSNNHPFYPENVLMAANQIIKKQTREYIKRYDQPAKSGLFGYTSLNNAFAAARVYAGSEGLEATTTECFRKFPEEVEYYSPKTIKACTEFFGNFIGTVVKQFKDNQN